MRKIIREKLAKIIEERAKADLEACNIGGASVLVAQSGEIVYKNHFGAFSPDGESVSDHTLFRIASMTKPITSVATMILVDRGLLSLDDTVDRFYPSFSSMCVRQEDGTTVSVDKKITIRNILTHSSGIGSGKVWNDSVNKMKDINYDSVEHFVEFLSTEPLSYIPGTKLEYSGIGSFSVLTGIIQKITGMPYGEFLKKEIFEPCEMIDTTFEPSREQWARLITMHDKVDGKGAIGQTYDGCVFEFIPPQNHLGGAGLISSLNDYLHFAQMLLNGGIFNGKRVVSQKAIEEISKPQMQINPAGDSWGLGVYILSKDAATRPESYGWCGAYGTHFWVDPINEIIGLYMRNSRYDGGGGKIGKNFEDDVYHSTK